MAEKAKPALSLDALVEEHQKSADKVEPFVLDGVGPDKVSVTFRSPQDLDWEEAQAMAEAAEHNDMRTVFWTLIDDDDELNAWGEAQVPAEVAGKVFEKYLRHHGWDPVRGRLSRRDRRAAK